MGTRPSIGIVGLGLIGGSAAKAFGQAGFSVYGYDLDDATMDKAHSESVIVNRAVDWRDWADSVDWVVMAMPLARVTRWLALWAEQVMRAQVIIDVSSVKGSVLPALSALPDRFTPVCLHPMAGRELTGYAASRADLFRGHVCAVIPVPHRELAPESLVNEILQVLGMHPYATDGTMHDQVAALVSHLPYLVSAALLVTAERAGQPLSGWQRMAGPGFMDTSRVGSSSPDLWTEILNQNREAVLPVLDVFSEVIANWNQELRRELPLAELNTAPAIRSRVEEERSCS